ncbi:P22 phage major capsid protein family protein [Roseovarius sp. MMSF_3281]|uniref:P22 phage major capsid protein family protein n=1 Tax=Roseovarius sp. MMSF_3281 TaxID=3046694 RepID=UPI00273E185F|nr:P22 phage major capsid protein family protein [Roseovarius sp. MMSF_3281]
MANNLTAVMPTLYAALSEVSRELIGFIPNVNRDSTTEMAAVGQTVQSPVVPQNTLEDITPGNDPADSGDQTIGNVNVTISKSKAYPIRWTGEEQKALSPYGQINTILRDQFAQGFRTLANAVESDLAAQYVNASRAYGTPGTTPFATADDMTDLSEINRILDENGAPQGGRVMVVGSSARAKLEGKQSQLFKANEAGDAGALLRNREMRRLHGFVMGYSAGINAHTAGTSAASSPDYLVDLGAGYDAGDTSIHLDTGTGDHLSGDVISFAGDPNKYVIGTGAAGDGDKDIVINDPGLLLALDDGVVATTDASYTANLGFHQNALLLAARQPAMPEGGDAADDVTTLVDPVSGLTFQVAVYHQYRRVKFEIGLAWGTAAPNPKWLSILQG